MVKNSITDFNLDLKEVTDSLEPTSENLFNANFDLPNLDSKEEKKLKNDLNKEYWKQLENETKKDNVLQEEKSNLNNKKDVTYNFFDPKKTPNSLGPLVKTNYLPSHNDNFSTEELERLEYEHDNPNLALDANLNPLPQYELFKTDKEKTTIFKNKTKNEPTSSLWEIVSQKQREKANMESLEIKSALGKAMKVRKHIEYTDLNYEDLKKSKEKFYQGISNPVQEYNPNNTWYAKIKHFFKRTNLRLAHHDKKRGFNENVYQTGEHLKYNFKIKTLHNGKTRVKNVRKKHALNWKNPILATGRSLAPIGLLFSLLSTFIFTSWFTGSNVVNIHYNLYTLVDSFIPNLFNLSNSDFWSPSRVFNIMVEGSLLIILITPLMVSSNKKVLFFFASLLNLISVIWFSYSFYGYFAIQDEQLIVGSGSFIASQVLWAASILGTSFIIHEVFLA
ncbi:hypothetical protein [Spiroplasma endosymbiont of Amphibalanus improvisus]|uniref:hypothetical protein n=1 Tax=Spiroplasma endosymbiont of Amphibalanus improvisus TaxID=3066327 RepID=UPI00313AE92A